MTKPILEIRQISKKFRIDHQRVPYLSLREWLAGALRRTASKEDFWALKDVSFDVQAGESIGIIGRNGAGKSTLLKVLSRITPPTSGRIRLRGRVASLLEVGTGFHPELTGRENIFLNGSILGMRRTEILSRFDQIVDFSGTDRFLDTPLKHYSSGMQLRLAFSVAAFLEPEILIIDEVLAVGDAEFQKKCIGKMEEVSTSGRTVLFVSHNMTAISNLCRRAVLLQAGRIHGIGTSPEMVEAYRRMIEADTGNSDGLMILSDNGTNQVIRRIEILSNGSRSGTVSMGSSLEVRVHFHSHIQLDYPVLGVVIKDNQNTPLLGVNNKHYIGNLISAPVTEGYIGMKIPHLSLFEGSYLLDIHFGNGFSDIQVVRDCLQLTVESNRPDGLADMPSKQLNRIFIKDIAWEFSPRPMHD